MIKFETKTKQRLDSTYSKKPPIKPKERNH